MCMGGCGGSGGGRSSRSASSGSYTPKKIKNASKASNITGFASKPRGGYSGAASWGSAKVNMSHFGRKR